MDVEQLLGNFKEDLGNQELSEAELVERHILFGTPYLFNANEQLYFELKREIANKFTLSTTQIVVVGSAKLGFSIAPTKLWRTVNDESDIDAVIISEELFDHFWKQLHTFNINLTSRSFTEDKLYRNFLDYFFKGWIRPDKFPFSYPFKQEWFDFFGSISYKKYDKRKVTGAVFKNEYFFKQYHEANLRKLRAGGFR
ncbi:hypothetical protein [Paenibacillus typhae]|uniref:Uncharacterized protein n=1 Tax=Paenibacillus typhae TaxID=1174501 RepID=A0A1G8Y173_9BACL|nr:hypothetical protein [Paenibacillus typhae]SDJ96457.1 hypothetical protein SAMN05216192_12810 [Paenibacillus typhae]